LYVERELVVLDCAAFAQELSGNNYDTVGLRIGRIDDG